MSKDANKDLVPDGIYLPILRRQGNNYLRFTYRLSSGTSFSAPHVSALAALLKSKGLSNSSLLRKLKSTSKDLGASGVDNIYGNGLIQSPKALKGL